MELKELNGQVYQVLKSIAQRNSNYTQLNSLIQKVFTSMDLLNISFKQYYNKKVNAQDANINFNGLEMFYKDMIENITGIKGGFHSETCLKFLEPEGKLVDFIKQGDASYANMRCILILVFCPMIYDNLNGNQFIRFAVLLTKLKENQKDCLSRWLVSMKKQQFETIILQIHKVLVSLMSMYNIEAADKKVLNESLGACCSFLVIFFKSNNIQSRLPMSLFQNESLMNFFKAPDQFKPPKNKPLFKIIQYPFLLDTHYKLKLLELQNQQEQRLKMEEGMLYLIQNAEDEQEYIDMESTQIDDLYLLLKINRENILEDVKSQLSGEETNLKNPLKVEFVGEVGNDIGGIKKQCLQLLTKQLFDPDKQVIVTKNNNRFYWFNGNNQDNQMVQFMGTIAGLAIYNGVMLDLKFPLLLYKLLMKKNVNNIEQLIEIEPDFYKTFKYIMETNEPLDSMELTFTAQNIVNGKRVSIPLTHKGQNIKVTQFNKNSYVELYLKYLINIQISTQLNAFRTGFQKVITGNMVKLLEPQQLQMVLCGLQIIDFNDLKKSAKYQGYQPDSPIVCYLWQILEGFDQERKKSFLSFATGSDRSPIGGLSTMKFTIQRHGADTENILSAHTCSNVLLLPEYSSKQKLYKKLIIALNHNQGFGLI